MVWCSSYTPALLYIQHQERTSDTKHRRRRKKIIHSFFHWDKRRQSNKKSTLNQVTTKEDKAKRLINSFYLNPWLDPNFILFNGSDASSFNNINWYSFSSRRVNLINVRWITEKERERATEIINCKFWGFALLPTNKRKWKNKLESFLSV